MSAKRHAAGSQNLYRKGHTMSLLHSVKRFVISEDGPTAVEYAVMLALIVVVCLTAIQAVGTNANNKFNAVKNALT
jgi:pilus assembly protein Flp/PilA